MRRKQIARRGQPRLRLGRLAGGGERHQAAEDETGSRVDPPCQHQRLVAGLHAATAAAGVALDQHLELTGCVREGSGQPLDGGRAVGGDGEDDTVVQRSQPVELLPADDVVGEKDVGQAGIGHHLGLADLLAGNAVGARLDLPFGKEGQLVGLDMGPEPRAGRVGGLLGAGDVALDAVEVDQNGGRVDLIDGSGGGGHGFT